MTDIRAKIDVRELDPVELAGVVGGDDFCGTVVPGFPIPRPGGNPSYTGSPVNVVLPGLAAGGTIGFVF
jgi:hypothetical protein